MADLWMPSVGVRVDISVVHEVDGSIVWRYGGPYDAVPGVPGVLSTVLGGSTHRESPAHRSHRSGRSGAAQRAAKRVFFLPLLSWVLGHG